MYLVALAPGRGPERTAMPGGAGDPRLRGVLCHLGQPVENLVDCAGATASAVPAGGWGWGGADAWPTRQRTGVSTARRYTDGGATRHHRVPHRLAWSLAPQPMLTRGGLQHGVSPRWCTTSMTEMALCHTSVWGGGAKYGMVCVLTRAGRDQRCRQAGRGASPPLGRVASVARCRGGCYGPSRPSC